MSNLSLHSERHFRAYFERAMVGMAATSEEKGWLEANEALCTMLGYSREELMRLTWDKLTHPDDLAANEILFNRVLLGEINEYTMDKRFLRKDGTIVYVHIALRALRRADGSVDYIVLLVEDISEHKQREAEIIASEERLSTLIDAIPDAVFFKDGEGRWLITNEPAKQMFHLHALPWQGKTAMELAALHPAFRAAHEGFLVGDENVWQAGQLLAGEESQTGEDGRCAIIETRKVPLFGKAGQRKGLVVIARDVTERRRIESHLHESQQMLRRLAAHSNNIREVEKKRIAREVHDELGQQLTALRMTLSFAAQQHGENQEMIGQIAKLHLQVDRMVGVVRNVISNLRPAPLDLGIVPALEWLAKDFELHSGIHCRLRMPVGADDADDTLTLDDVRATAVFRIVQESLTNVARHSGANKVTISLTVAQNYIALLVKDNGKGFAPADTKAGKSFGLLGMQERVLLMQGELHIDSAPGKGTAISFKLPFERRVRTRTGAREHKTNRHGVQGE